MLTLDKTLKWLQLLDDVYKEQKEYLTELDSAIGDADHGINMNRGFTAVSAELNAAKPETIAEALKKTSMALIKNVGGASGPLYGTFFIRMSKEAEGKKVLSPEDVFNALKAGYDGVVERGKARPGDKTMLDVLGPVIDNMNQLISQGSTDLTEMMRNLSSFAKIKMEETINMIAKKGRASYLGERSKGHQDPGATSSYYMIDAASKTW